MLRAQPPSTSVAPGFLRSSAYGGAIWVSCKDVSTTQPRHGHDSCFHEATMNIIDSDGQRKQQASKWGQGTM